jgi:2-methylcitrate dehydratase PrpD
VLRPFGHDANDPRQLLDALGARYDITETSLKRHACCGLTHASIDAMLLLAERPEVTFDAIESVDIQLPTKAVARIDGNILWSHNVQYVVALAAHEGRVTLEHFTEEWTSHPEISKLAAATTVRASDELDAAFPAKKGSIVTVRTRDGEFVQKVDAPRGSPGEPMTERELHDKFTHLATAVLDESAAAAVWDELVSAPLDRPPTRLLANLVPVDTPS